jgi:asparagine synthase (glutamine-hydrolysing)
MCRIFGFIEKKPNKNILDNMQEVLKSGGPDNYGFYIDKDIAIGHRRLSIIDLSENANQPMEFDNLVISYNGEVYNFKEIKNELKEYEFKTNSDTEVILKAFHKWGWEAVKKFRGMFAIAIWDKKRKKLTLIRDRVGVKPLYYYFDGNVFIFASEIKALLKHPEFKKDIDKKSAILFFELGFIPTPYSIFKNCKKLDNASILEFDGKEIKIFKYWDFLEYANLPKIEKKEDEILEELEAILKESFKLRMIADVEVGLFLSGGIDSSLLASILSKEYNLKTFTIGFKDKKFNEADIAKKTAKILGTTHTEYYFDIKDMLNLLPKIVEIFDEPFADSSMFPTYLVSHIAAKELKVVLSADGADELFWGYPSNFKNAKRFKKYQKFMFLKPILSLFNNRKIKKKYYMLQKDMFKYKLATRYKIFPDEFSEFFELEDDLKCKDYIECAFLFDYKYFLSDDVLVKVDRNTMANSLEAREPFLDQNIAEFALRLPKYYKYKDGKTKYILRKLLYKYLPNEIVNLPKKGFSIPIKYWLRNELKKDVLEVINTSSFVDELLDKKKIINSFYKSGNRTGEVWSMYIFNLWYEKYAK